MQDLQKGEEVLLYYAGKSNDDLLRDYGFTVQGNPLDRVALDASAT
jgi:hypothetical protein